jgi:hypothetical protein
MVDGRQIAKICFEPHCAVLGVQLDRPVENLQGQGTDRSLLLLKHHGAVENAD